MTLEIQNALPPLQEDASGAVRVGGTRVLLELVLHAFQDGATPEAIVQRYPPLRLADVYAAIAYHLQYPEATERYLAERQRLAYQVRQCIEEQQGNLAEIRARLLARRTA